MVDMQRYVPDTPMDRLVQWIGKEYGLVIDTRRRDMLATRLQRHIRELGLNSMEEYADYLMNQGGIHHDERALLDAATTQTTSFFREKNHFDFIEQTILPQFYEHNKGRNGVLKAWSAAGSSGMEAYTLAMVLDHTIAQRAYAMDFIVYVSDISDKALRSIRHATYSREDIAAIPRDMRYKYLLKHKNPGIPKVRIVSALRDKVTIKTVNLVQPVYQGIPKHLDLIMLRNVLIYFDQPTQQRIITSVLEHLKPEGYLMVGHSENIQHYRTLGLKSVQPATYQKTTT